MAKKRSPIKGSTLPVPDVMMPTKKGKVSGARGKYFLTVGRRRMEIPVGTVVSAWAGKSKRFSNHSFFLNEGEKNDNCKKNFMQIDSLDHVRNTNHHFVWRFLRVCGVESWPADRQRRGR